VFCLIWVKYKHHMNNYVAYKDSSFLLCVYIYMGFNKLNLILQEIYRE